MKRVVLSLMIFSCLAAGVSSCSKSGGEGVNGPDSVRVSLSSSTVEGNGFEPVTITVTDKNGNNVTGSAVIYVDGVAIDSNMYIPSVQKTFVITAKKGTMPSNEALLNVSARSNSPFTQKVLVEDFTGTWCQYCTRVARSLEEYVEKKPACITVGIHGGRNSDPFYYQYIYKLESNYKIGGYPWAMVNHSGVKWNEGTSVLNTELSKWAPLGLSVQSSVNGTSISGKVQVKYNVTTSIPMKIMIMLVEDELVYPQINYYDNPAMSPYYGPTIIEDFVHTNVLRQIYSADVVNGDDIPVNAQTKENVWTKNFTFGTTGKTGIGTTYSIEDISKAKIIAFVSYGDNAFKRVGTLNVQSAVVGTTQNFD